MISFTILVPPDVPSVENYSRPKVVPPSDATKYSLLLKTFKFVGKLLPIPILISFTRLVPAAVPSVDHSSSPKVAEVAAKNNRLLKIVNLLGELDPDPGLRSNDVMLGTGNGEVDGVREIELVGEFEGVFDFVGEFEGVLLGEGGTPLADEGELLGEGGTPITTNALAGFGKGATAFLIEKDVFAQVVIV